MQNVNIVKIISEMSIDQKIGQMFMANICGGETLDTAKRDFEELHISNLQFSGVFECFVRGGDYMPCGVSKNRRAGRNRCRQFSRHVCYWNL